jgi:hypothetical protein
MNSTCNPANGLDARNALPMVAWEQMRAMIAILLIVYDLKMARAGTTFGTSHNSAA